MKVRLYSVNNCWEDQQEYNPPSNEIPSVSDNPPSNEIPSVSDNPPSNEIPSVSESH